jgi:N-dimethylarginine dimethylaminohydrolase
MKTFRIHSEIGKLKIAIMGTTDEFTMGERINEGMRKYYGTKNGPQVNKLTQEYRMLQDILEKYGVTVLQPQASSGVPQQLAPRDIGFVIGDTFVFSNMTWESRKKEAVFIKHIIDQFKGNVLRTPKNVYLEGGNIVIDGNNIFVGIGIRTTPNAIDFLKANFGPDYKIIPIAICEHEEVIHLDAVFNILDDGIVLIYKKCLTKLPSELSDYKIIGITKQEKDSGGCNFLSIDKKLKSSEMI